MKVTIVIPFLVCAFSAVKAQTTQPQNLIDIIKENPATSQTAIIKTPSIKLPQATLLSVNEKGKIYALPQDNMPCLVPDKTKTAVIPNAAPFVIPGNKIPNAAQVYPVIPKQ